MTLPQLWSTVADAAHNFQVPEHVIRRWVRKGELLAIKSSTRGLVVETAQAEQLAQQRRDRGSARPAWERLFGALPPIPPSNGMDYIDRTPVPPETGDTTSPVVVKDIND